MQGSSDYWDCAYGGTERVQPRYDGWLNRYESALKSGAIVVDLGCGNGVNAMALKHMSVDAICCDYSEVALAAVRLVLPDARTMCFDMREGIPFEDESVDVVLADLCLHYFDASTTLRVAAEIRRILRPGGCLISRVNSKLGFLPGDADVEIEKGYCMHRGFPRRYFDLDDVIRFFGALHIEKAFEESTEKYGSVKRVIEFKAEKEL